MEILRVDAAKFPATDEKVRSQEKEVLSLLRPEAALPAGIVLPRRPPYGFEDHRRSMEDLFDGLVYQEDEDSDGEYVCLMIDKDQWVRWCDEENQRIVEQVFLE